jgi:hypothetical protein
VVCRLPRQDWSSLRVNLPLVHLRMRYVGGSLMLGEPVHICGRILSLGNRSSRPRLEVFVHKGLCAAGNLDRPPSRRVEHLWQGLLTLNTLLSTMDIAESTTTGLHMLCFRSPALMPLINVCCFHQADILSIAVFRPFARVGQSSVES